MQKLRNNLRGTRAVLIMLGIILVFSGIMSAGCGVSGSKTETKPVTYTVGDATGDWGFPSPYGHYPRGPGYIRMSLIFDTLIWKNQHGFVPALAKSWEYLKEENAYLFNLQTEALWHDGKKFSARDVAFTINYMQRHPIPWADLSIVRQVEVIDEQTVKFYLNNPYAPFLDTVAGVVPILPEHIWGMVESPRDFREKGSLIGSGPFKAVDYNKEQGTYLFAANEKYYQGKPSVDRLQFVRIAPQVAASALRQQQVNVIQAPPELVGDLEKEGFKILSGSLDWVAKMMINHRKGVMTNRSFRHALAYAIDRQALVEISLRGHGLPGSQGLLSSDSAWYNPAVRGYEHNPSKAKEILQGLGYTRQGDFYQKEGQVLELELLVAGGTAITGGFPGERVGEMIKSQLQSVGIKINLRSLERKTLDNRLGEWQFELALTGHGGLGGDPIILNRAILGQGFFSARYTDNEPLARYLKSQLAEIDSEKRRYLVAKAQEIYAEELPAITLYYPTNYWAHDGRVTFFNTFGGIGPGVPSPFNKMAFFRN